MALAIATVKAGIGAGVLGGLAMVAWLATYTAFTGRGLLLAPRLFGAALYGRAALGPGPWPAFWGLVIHLAVAASLGVLFASIFHRDVGAFEEVAAAIVFGLLVWVVMTFLVLPVADPVLRSAVPEMSMGWFGSHVAYGGVLGLAQQLRHQLVEPVEA